MNRNVMCCPAPYAIAGTRSAAVAGPGTCQSTLHLARAPITTSGCAIGKRARNSSWTVARGTGERTAVRPGLPAAQIQNGHCTAARQLHRHLHARSWFAGDCRAGSHHRLTTSWSVVAWGSRRATRKRILRLAKKLAFVTPDQVRWCVAAVIEVQRDHGNRADRKVARLKYLVDRLGIDVFRAKVEEYLRQSACGSTSGRCS